MRCTTWPVAPAARLVAAPARPLPSPDPDPFFDESTSCPPPRDESAALRHGAREDGTITRAGCTPAAAGRMAGPHLQTRHVHTTLSPHVGDDVLDEIAPKMDLYVHTTGTNTWTGGGHAGPPLRRGSPRGGGG